MARPPPSSSIPCSPPPSIPPPEAATDFLLLDRQNSLHLASRRFLCAVIRGNPQGDLRPVMAMLKAPEHQVAGHQALEGQLGPLVDGAGRFYKPLQGNGRGDDEVAFYSSLTAHPSISPRIRSFFPGFHGVAVLSASDGSGDCRHLVLEDLVAGARFPSVIDLKIGARTWPPVCADDYFRKCIKKDRESTSVALGFRISGLQVQQAVADGDGRSCPGRIWKPDRANIKRYTIPDVRRVLRQFVSTNSPSDPTPDCALAGAVYGGAGGILEQLLVLKDWFEQQTVFHFYSVSVLFMYEKDALEAADAASEVSPEGMKPPVRVKLVDFAHVFDGDGVIDHNFLGGLCSVIKFISEIVTESTDHEGGEAKKITQLNNANGI